MAFLVSDSSLPTPDSASTPAADNTASSGRSPLAGCFIFIAAGCILFGLVAWTLWSLYYQGREIAKFTDESPTDTPIALVADHSTEIENLVTRFETFQKLIEKKEAAELRLSPLDINLAIAEFDALKELRKTFYIHAISKDAMEIQISYHLNSSFFHKRPNNLNASIKAAPILIPDEFAIRISEITPSVGTVPQPFLEHISLHRLMENFKKGESRENQTVYTLMSSLTAVELTDGALLLTFNPEVSAPSHDTEITEERKNQTLLLFMSISSVVLAAIAIALVVAKRKKS